MISFAVVVVGGLVGATLLWVAVAYGNTAVSRSRVRARVEDLKRSASTGGWTYRTRAWVLAGSPWTDRGAEEAGVDGDGGIDHVLETRRQGHRVVVTERTERAGESVWTEVHGRLDRSMPGVSVELNPARRTPFRRVHLLDDELDARWWVESDDAAGTDELLLAAHDLLRATTVPPAWSVAIDATGLRVRWRGELTVHAADGVAALLVGLAEVLATVRPPSPPAGTRR